MSNHPSPKAARRPSYALPMFVATLLVGVLLTLLSGHPRFAHARSEAQAGSLSTSGLIASSCEPNWQIVQSPNPRTSNRLNSVAAISPSDVWAVGYYFDFAQTPDHTLTMHWDGTAWTQVPSPNPVAGSYLEDVVALAPDNVWAVGYAYISTARTLIEHWDGAQWSVVPSPNQDSSTNELMAIDAISPTDIWAVGNTPGSHNTVTLHWDGSQWLVVPSLPNNFSTYFGLEDVVAIASDDVWAVGYEYPESGAHRTVIIHWDGTSWSRVSSPNPGAYVSRLYGVVAASANEIWAVGLYSNNGGSTYQTLILKWDGISWSHVPSPDGSVSGYNILFGITRGADGELWAVGKYHIQNHPSSPGNTLILRWDGSTWQVVGSPNGFRSNSELYGVDSAPSGDLWAVGRSYNDYNTPWDTLIERNICAELTPTATGTPPTATVTRTPTPFLSPTPTACVTNYTIATTTGTIEPGTTDIGNHTDDGVTFITLPFPYTLYNQTFTGANISSNGVVEFVGEFTSYLNTCMPVTAPAFTYSILPLWDDQITRPTGKGIFTSVSGTAPNRIFNIEFRTCSYFSPTQCATGTDSNYEVRLYEGQTRFDIVYGVMGLTGSSATVGVQKNSANYTQYLCNTAGLTNGLQLTFTLASCSTATPGTPTIALPSSTSTSTSVIPSSTATSTSTTTPIPSTQTPSVSTHTATSVASGTPSISTPTPGTCPIQFSDVPEGSTFYADIRCLACRNILGGYSDGTFRPGNNATRGQLSKIVSNAAGFTEPVSGQTFSDVSPNHTFYEFIERMAARGIIGGYSDGTFRPGNPATRGQIAKIVANAAHFTEPVSGQTFTDVLPGTTFYEFIERMASRGIIGGYSDGTFRPQNNATRGQTSKIVANTFFQECNPSTRP